MLLQEMVMRRHAPADPKIDIVPLRLPKWCSIITQDGTIACEPLDVALVVQKIPLDVFGWNPMMKLPKTPIEGVYVLMRPERHYYLHYKDVFRYGASEARMKYCISQGDECLIQLDIDTKIEGDPHK